METGSGKTITSFKTALFLSTRVGFDKVIFLVDRRELDKNTSEKFKSYSAYEPVSVDDTRSTYHLKKQLKSDSSGIVVTTTFKLNSLVKEFTENKDDSLGYKRFVFIIDEAHRTTMGQMMGTIKHFFRKNSLFFGFTGTPLFEENMVPGMVNRQSEVINTTEKLFGPLLHEYTIDEAIRDCNVLGFHVDYINTGEFRSYDQLRTDLRGILANKYPQRSDIEIQREVVSMSRADLERTAVAEGLLEYHDETHVPRVVSHILDNWEGQSQKRHFNAILTCAFKSRVVCYYHEFKKQLEERTQAMNVAITFSSGNENDTDNVEGPVIEEMYRDYFAITGMHFEPGISEDNYFSDLIYRFKRGGSGLNPKNIDLIIVADQLLTGYDSKRLNTLYVDRSLKLQGLIQAYSRTNRVYGRNKEFGSIINFQFPAITRENVELSLALYSSGGESSRAIVDRYDTAVEKFSIDVGHMRIALVDPTQWANLRGHTKEEEDFKETFKHALRQLNLVRQYYEFKWNDQNFGIDEHTWLQYVGAYKNLLVDQPADEGEIKELLGQTMLVDTHPIDLPFILSIIEKKINRGSQMQTVDEESLRLIYEQIQELSNMGDDRQAQLLRTFVDTYLITGQISSALPFDEAFATWKKRQESEEVDQFAKEWGIDLGLLKKSVQHYSKQQGNFVPYGDELIRTVDLESALNKEYSNALVHNMTLAKELPIFLGELEDKYRV